MELGASPPLDRLRVLRDALGHRGPDDSGIEVVDSVGLVHTRLAIVDIGPSSHQPMRHPAGRFWLAYNGEVYNHMGLRSEFDQDSFAGHSDTETVLWALERSGLDAVRRFSGQFAFAALDLEKRRLLLCRDRYGIKPLYLASFAGGTWFASEPGALVKAGAPAHPVNAAFGAIVMGSRYGGRQTLVESITRIGPGAWASIPLDGGSITTDRWFSPAQDVDSDLAEQLARCSRRELASTLKAALRSAVHGSLMSDVQVGTLLSGGVDSSLITALAVEAEPGLIAFAANHTGDRPYAEGAAAQRVAERLGIELEMIDVTPQSWRGGFVAATAHFGSPLTNASAVTVAQLAKRARDAGVKVLLTGEGADELFGGYGSLHADAFQPLLPRHHQLVQNVERALGEHPPSLQNWAAGLGDLWRAITEAINPPTPPSWATLSMPVGGPDVTYEALLGYMHHPPDVCRAEAGLLSRMDYTLCWLLNRTDKNLMQWSVEGRVPFLEPEVVRLVVNLPLATRIGPWSKGILRDVARSMLPRSIAYRPKVTGMDFDAGEWIEQGADPAFLSDGLLRESFGISKGELERVMATDNGRLRMRIWSAEVWCRSELAGHPIEQIEQALWRQ
jgi:asparagine synthase (glutamine-hydrolysing)